MSIDPGRPASSPVLIGREREVASLQILMDEARQGRGQVLLLSGEAGIGKSRLLAEGKRRASEQGFVVLQGACFPTDHFAPYAPLLDLFSTAPATELLARALDAPARLTRELRRLFPGLLDLTPDHAPDHARDPEQDKRRLFVTLSRFFTDLASEQPVLLAIEDLHWSDASSLELLHDLARRCARHPLLLVLTCRSDERRPELGTWLAQLEREHLVHESVLQPLSRAEVAAMVRAILDRPNPLSTAALDAIYDLTEGNPFFIEESLKSLVTTDVTGSAHEDEQPLPELPIPRSVQGVVEERLAQVSDEGRQLLALAAVAGRRFDFGLLQQITHQEEPALLSLMKEVIRAQLVVEETEERFAFRHALIRQAIYRELLLRERKTLHRVIAETIEQRSAAAPEVPLTELAYHFSEAGIWDKARSYAERAGERALALYAPRVAVEQFTRALEATDKLAASPPARVYRRRGEGYETLGEFDHARADYERARHASQTVHDHQMEWQSVIDLGFLWAGRDYQQAGAYFQEAVHLARQLNDPTRHAHSLNRLGNWLVNTGQVTEGLRMHDQALDAFTRQHDRAGMAETHDLLGMALAWTGNFVEGWPHQERAVALFRALDDKKGLVSTLTNASIGLSPAVAETLFIVVREPEECVRGAMEAAQIARQIDWSAGEAYAELTTGALLGGAGQFDQALAHVRAGFQLAQEIEHQQWIVAAQHHFGHIHLHMLAPDLALRHLDTGLSLAVQLGSAWFVDSILALQALAHLQLGAYARAAATLNEALPRAKQARTLSERRLAWVWGELLLCQGEPKAALEIADQLLTTTPGAPCAQPIPRLLKLKGETLVALRRPSEAVEALEAARRGAQERREAPLLWQIDASLARVHGLLKREAEARDAVAAARDGIEALAQAIDDPTLREQFMQRARTSLPPIKPISPRRAAAAQYGGLTERERAVTVLIAQGKTSREIAELLAISERTAEGHVNNILGKLGFASRARIAAWAVERGLTRG